MIDDKAPGEDRQGGAHEEGDRDEQPAGHQSLWPDGCAPGKSRRREKSGHAGEKGKEERQAGGR
jgi:hypothetical protein